MLSFFIKSLSSPRPQIFENFRKLSETLLTSYNFKNVARNLIFRAGLSQKYY